MEIWCTVYIGAALMVREYYFVHFYILFTISTKEILVCIPGGPLGAKNTPFWVCFFQLVQNSIYVWLFMGFSCCRIKIYMLYGLELHSLSSFVRIMRPQGVKIVLKSSKIAKNYTFSPMTSVSSIIFFWKLSQMWGQLCQIYVSLDIVSSRVPAPTFFQAPPQLYPPHPIIGKC